MSADGQVAELDVRTLSADTLSEYELIEECILSGQVSDAKVQSMVRTDPVFGRWLRARVTDRTR
jgi:hypothetical protein